MTDRVTDRLTPRLRLRRLRASDLDVLAEIYADPQVMRFIRDGSVSSREETEAHLARIHAEWDERGYGLFGVEERATGRLTGWAGLAVPAFLPEVLPSVEIGWRLGREYWGRGYATEAAREALHFAFTEAGLDRVVSICDVDHTASANVMRKLGLRPERHTVVPGTGKPVQVLALERGEYVDGR